jgi:hypothetical protein
MINGIGFGMENLSPIGKLRNMDDHNKPVNATAKFLTTDGEELEYDGIKGLNQLLSRSERGRQCMATQIFRYVYGRIESVDDQCTIAQARVNTLNTGTRLTDLLIELYTSSLYLNRQ